MANPLITFIDEPVLRVASRVSKFWYRSLRVAPPRQRWIALIAIFIPFFLYNCAILPRSVNDSVLTAESFVLAVCLLLGTIAMLVAASAQLKMTSTEWDAARYKQALATAKWREENSRMIRFLFPISGSINLLLNHSTVGDVSTIPSMTAQLGLWFLGITSVSYLMACEPPQPDDGDGFVALPSRG